MPKFTSIKEMIAMMPTAFSPEMAAGMNTTLQLDLTGEGGGQWYCVIADKTLQVHEGTASNASMTLTVSAKDYLSLSNGESNPMNLFMQGKIKIKGDMQLAMKLQSLFKFS